MPFLDSHQWIANQSRIAILAWSRKFGMVDGCNFDGDDDDDLHGDGRRFTVKSLLTMW